MPGVGRKTANVVLGHALGVPGLPVDRHVLRVANRIGLAEGDDPVEVEAQLCGVLPPEQWTLASDVLDPARPPRVPAETRSASGARLRLTDCGYSARSAGRRARKPPSARPQARSKTTAKTAGGRR